LKCVKRALRWPERCVPTFVFQQTMGLRCRDGRTNQPVSSNLVAITGVAVRFLNANGFPAAPLALALVLGAFLQISPFNSAIRAQGSRSWLSSTD
jgi:hypothetical protein